MKRCLIVDDSKVIRMVARKIIQEIGLDTEEASDGHEALESCDKTIPDAILLDWRLPGMTGIELLRALRGKPGGETPVIIFSTTEDDTDHINEALAAGASDYILKPFDSESIRAKFLQLGLVD
ncbi:response regulator [Thalassospiraceae bacterium LMO-JJ14]|nr:response regulator [Thalassospiraceae bacterium LMO-JJ14]